MISVFITDDHTIFREGLHQIITLQNDMKVCGAAEDGETAVALLSNTPCDVLLLDLSMPGISGMSLLNRVHRLLPKLPILVLSMHQQRPYVVEAFRCGAAGYVTKASPSNELLRGIRRLARGGMFASAIAAEQLATRLRDAGSKDPEASLTPRERQILFLLIGGSRVSDIAGMLNLSEKTVSTHKVRLQNKIGVSSLAGLVRYAIEHGMTESTE